MKASHFIMSDHAKKRAVQRGIPNAAIWSACRSAVRNNLKSSLEEQHRRLSPMLTDKSLKFRVGRTLFKASACEISTRLDIDGTTIAVGIRRIGKDYSSLTCTTAWN